MCSACSLTLKKHHICGTGITASALLAGFCHMAKDNNDKKICEVVLYFHTFSVSTFIPKRMCISESVKNF